MSNENDQVTLDTPHLSTTVLPYGHHITSLVVDANTDVLAGFRDTDVYHHSISNRAFLNAVVGRYANRLPSGETVLSTGAKLHLPGAAGVCLHGGEAAFDTLPWAPVERSQSLLFAQDDPDHPVPPPPSDPNEPVSESSTLHRLYSPAGAEGFPCSLEVEALVVVLAPDKRDGAPTTAEGKEGTSLGKVKVVLRAKIREDGDDDIPKGTPVNLTVHWGFRLDDGKDKDVLGHHLWLDVRRLAHLALLLPLLPRLSKLTLASSSRSSPTSSSSLRLAVLSLPLAVGQARRARRVGPLDRRARARRGGLAARLFLAGAQGPAQEDRRQVPRGRRRCVATSLCASSIQLEEHVPDSLSVPRRADRNFLFSHPSSSLQPSPLDQPTSESSQWSPRLPTTPQAILTSPSSHLSLRFTSNQSSVQVYTAPGLDGTGPVRKVAHGGPARADAKGGAASAASGRATSKGDGYGADSLVFLEFQAPVGAVVHAAGAQAGEGERPELARWMRERAEAQGVNLDEGKKGRSWEADTLLRKGQVYENWVEVEVVRLE